MHSDEMSALAHQVKAAIHKKAEADKEHRKLGEHPDGRLCDDAALNAQVLAWLISKVRLVGLVRLKNDSFFTQRTRLLTRVDVPNASSGCYFEDAGFILMNMHIYIALL
jgi:hypothetical protein